MCLCRSDLSVRWNGDSQQKLPDPGALLLGLADVKNGETFVFCLLAEGSVCIKANAQSCGECIQVSESCGWCTDIVSSAAGNASSSLKHLSSTFEGDKRSPGG